MGVILDAIKDVDLGGEMTSSQALAESGLYARMVEDVRDTAFTAAEIADITGVKVRQVQHWASGAHRPQADARDRLLELHYIVERLRDIYTPEGIEIWVHGRNRALGGEKPIELLRAGEFERVLAEIERLAAGAM
jgi:DNA-binding transcriptional regulator YiaG